MSCLVPSSFLLPSSSSPMEPRSRLSVPQSSYVPVADPATVTIVCGAHEIITPENIRQEDWDARGPGSAQSLPESSLLSSPFVWELKVNSTTGSNGYGARVSAAGYILTPTVSASSAYAWRGVDARRAGSGVRNELHEAPPAVAAALESRLPPNRIPLVAQDQAQAAGAGSPVQDEDMYFPPARLVLRTGRTPETQADLSPMAVDGLEHTQEQALGSSESDPFQHFSPGSQVRWERDHCMGEVSFADWFNSFVNFWQRISKCLSCSASQPQPLWFLLSSEPTIPVSGILRAVYSVGLPFFLLARFALPTPIQTASGGISADVYSPACRQSTRTHRADTVDEANTKTTIWAVKLPLYVFNSKSPDSGSQQSTTPAQVDARYGILLQWVLSLAFRSATVAVNPRVERKKNDPSDVHTTSSRVDRSVWTFFLAQTYSNPDSNSVPTDLDTQFLVPSSVCASPLIYTTAAPPYRTVGKAHKAILETPLQARPSLGKDKHMQFNGTFPCMNILHVCPPAFLTLHSDGRTNLQSSRLQPPSANPAAMGRMLPPALPNRHAARATHASQAGGHRIPSDMPVSILNSPYNRLPAASAPTQLMRSHGDGEQLDGTGGGAPEDSEVINTQQREARVPSTYVIGRKTEIQSWPPERSLKDQNSQAVWISPQTRNRFHGGHANIEH
ncbi:hypothetical protein DFH09DRAFT_1081910 [Mycena vulgaris]|nr:hypothetical protein DFH09DRAFT_1081910 [Mycena vulgaris]